MSPATWRRIVHSPRSSVLGPRFVGGVGQPRTEDRGPRTSYPVVVVGGGCVSDGAGGAVSVDGGIVLVAGGGPSTEVVIVSVVAGSAFDGSGFVSVFATTGGR